MPNAPRWPSPKPSLGSATAPILSSTRSWDEAARHYDERALAALVIAIAGSNVWNRLNVATRQVAGDWAKSAEAKNWVETGAASR
jgi:hypothetical protein